MPCKDAMDIVSTIHGTVPQPVRWVKHMGHKQYLDNYVSSPLLLEDFHNGKIGSCDTVCHYRNKIPANFNPKYFKFKKRNTVSTMHDNPMALCSTVLQNKIQEFSTIL
jgi:hypothetical protein